MDTGEWVASARQRIDDKLAQYIEGLSDQPTPLKEAMGYSLLNGGKRIRPLLSLITAEMLGVSDTIALDIGAAIECIHAYSLIHDDLPAMDNDDLRRGQPTCHIKFDEATAILAGDALQSLAFDILCDQHISNVDAVATLSLIKQLANASGYEGMCGGQAIDLASTGNHQHIEDKLERIVHLHHLKTGALIEASIMMPASLSSSLTDAQRTNLLTFAKSVGLAFQVQDDILDREGDPAQTGKPTGSDDDLDKLTFPQILGIDGTKAYLRKLSGEALQALEALPYNTTLFANFCSKLIYRDH